MTRLLIAYDASEAARAATAAAAGLFGRAEAVVATVHPPGPTLDSATLARVALPDAMIREGIELMQADAHERVRETALEGAQLAASAGLRATSRVLPGAGAWRALRDEARHRRRRRGLRDERRRRARPGRRRDLEGHCDGERRGGGRICAQPRPRRARRHPGVRPRNWQALLEGARDAGASAILVGSHGRGAITSTVLDSVASGLVHAAALPVLVVPRQRASSATGARASAPRPR